MPLTNFQKLKLLLLLHLYQRRKRRWSVRPVNRNRATHGEFALVREMRLKDPDYHFGYLRMSAQRFDDLLRRVSPLIQHRNTHEIPVRPAQRLTATLRFLASGDSQSSIAYSYHLGKSTFNSILYEVCDAIWRVLSSEFVAFPTTEKWREISLDFHNLWNFPLCCGALDGKHVVIQCPPNSGSQYFCYKGTFSVVLLALCDGRYRFTFVDIGGYGRQSDGGTLASSALGKALAEETINFPEATFLPGTDTLCPHVIVADEAFPQRINIMRPYPGKNLTNEKRIFNYRLSRARRISKNTFGILRARFRVFSRPIEALPQNAVRITKACVALHNYLQMSDAANPPTARYVPPTFVDYANENGQMQQGEWRRIVDGDSGMNDLGRVSSNMYGKAAATIRDRFSAYFLTGNGQVPWQNSVISQS